MLLVTFAKTTMMVDHSFGNVPKFATKHDLNLSMPFQLRTVSLVGNFGHRSASSSLSSSSKTDSSYNHHQSVGGDDEVDNNREVAMLSVQVPKLAGLLILMEEWATAEKKYFS